MTRAQLDLALAGIGMAACFFLGLGVRSPPPPPAPPVATAPIADEEGAFATGVLVATCVALDPRYSFEQCLDDIVEIGKRPDNAGARLPPTADPFRNAARAMDLVRPGGI